MNIQKMMQQAQEMQEKLQQQLRATTVEGTAGGGMVTVTMNGVKEVQGLKIDPEVVSAEDVEMLQDLIVAAIAEAQRRADELMSQQMGGMMGGMNIPGLT
ncbi:MAG: YbaB/EbfC family nucleoid-associated protein [Vicinamibacterales bacterium]|jgi:DNA-binding YbaB/EbfC family protein|nr:YbaB/EbfC family nucleoid-associated protein [Vicinamibacterales bacterium]|tara:strand:- start:599 stop:898 length:300 start_codon:yes stop_codon:yes gene_type:complete